jgi:hypothetical protein
MAEEGFPDMSSDDRDCIANGQHSAFWCAVSFILNVLCATQAEFLENLLPVMHAAEYTGVALDDSMRCDLN